jgi:glycosyltransferase involved in cell wall biosynthesis
MKIFFDARYIRTDFHDGISRYATGVGRALARQTDVTFIISDAAQLKRLPKNSKYVMLHPVTSWREPFAAFWLNKHHPDVVFTPLQTLGSIGRRFKLVLTVHDLTYYKHRTPPPQYNPFVRFVWWLYHLTYIPERLQLRGADLVATVSETVEREIREAKLTNKDIVVVPNAARDLSKLLDRPVTHSNKPPINLVYMGAFIPYKNAETLIQSLAYLTPKRTLHLLSRIKPERRAELEKLTPDGSTVVFHDGVTDEDYAYLLVDDAIMVSASRSEGFGLPLVEAIGIGTPAVVSDLAIFREVAGEGALYADPDSPQDFAAKIASLDDKKHREQLVAAGQKHIAKFNWNNSAKSLLAAIKNL